MKLRALGAALSALLFLPASLLAQEATVIGTVRDSTDAVLPGVTVTALNVDNGNTFLDVSDESGNYRLALRPATDIDALGLDLRLGATAVGLDRNSRRVHLADGAAVPYDALVVATGVRPRRLPGCDGVSGVHVLRTVEDALALKKRLRPDRRLVIVGGGFIGAEVAATARALGVAVTLLEADTVPMGQAVGDETGRFLTRIHLAHGVDVRTGTSVHEIRNVAGRVTGVLLSDGTVLPADDVLVAIGSLPNTEWLDGSGLALQDGLRCDEYCAAAPDVHGVGDVARWHNPLFEA